MGKKLTRVIDPLIGIQEFKWQGRSLGPLVHRETLIVLYLFEDSAPFTISTSNGWQRSMTAGALSVLWAGAAVEICGSRSDVEKRVHGLQLTFSQKLLCLPDGLECIYQPGDQTPVIELNGASMKVLCGRTSRGDNRELPNGGLTFVQLSVTKSSTCNVSIPRGYKAIIYLIDGSVTFSLFFASWTLANGDVIAVGGSCSDDNVGITAQHDSRIILIVCKPISTDKVNDTTNSNDSAVTAYRNISNDSTSTAFDTRIMILPI
jgi:redox-sensitive bicupin YhaK (pirin superfamily)